MYKKKNKKKKHLIIPIIIIIGFILVYLNDTYQTYTRLEIFIRDIGASIENLIIPKVKIDNTKLIDGLNKELERNNQELQKLLDLKIENYTLIQADVIRRDNIDWYQEITINKGKKDNLKINMAVVANDTLIGKIVKVSNNSSIVRLISSQSDNMKVSVNVETENEIVHGILNGYNLAENVILIDNINKNSDIKIGDKVYTNGLGGIYPSGIYIGVVSEITYDSLGLNKILKLKMNNKYDEIRYVTVISKEQKQ